MLPIGQISWFRLGSHFSLTRWLRATASNPLTPSTMILRPSSIDAAISAMRRPPIDASRCTHSAPARVLPNPRPAIISHTRQPSPEGGN
jgi:hypothetical protein